MKKYLMTAATALVLGGLTSSCTHDTDLSGGTARSSQDVQKTYEEAFLNTFGRPAEGLDWGFGLNTTASTRALTRASDLLKETYKNSLPKFRDKDDITEPTWPGLPTTLGGKTIYTTWEQVQNAKIPCADDVTSTNNEWTDVYTAYIDADHTNIRSDRSAGRTYYVNGDVKYWNGVSADGATFIVLEGSTLHLGSINHNIKIYLCRNATVDFTKTWEVKTDVISYWPYEATTTITEKDVEGVILEKSNAAIYMSEGSNVKAKTLEVFDGANIYNDGGTIEASYLYIHKNSNLYNNGGKVKVDDGKIYAFDGCKVLVDNGCKVTADQMDIDKNTTLWNNGSITVTKDIQGANENAFIYNAAGKTISAASLDLINNSDLLVNDGTVTITNGITLQNSGAEIVNNANMSCGSFSMAAGAMMFNVGNMTMTGKTFINNSNSGWQNEGEWECGSLEITGDDKTAGNVFNNCRLTVNGLFDLNRGSFILDSNAGVVCESFRIDDTSGFYFGNKSVLKINGTLTTSIINPEYGFFTYGSEYAVIQAEGIETTTNDPESINYYGNLLVAINPHLAANYYTAEPSVKFTKDGDNIATIPSSKCNPGYTGSGGGGGSGGVDPDATEVIVVAEDLSTYIDSNGKELADFDFNDVVFAVTKGNNGKVHIKLLAAGGTLPLTVGGAEGETVDNHGEQVLAYEVHRRFKVSTGTMVNTNSTTNGATRDPVEFDIDYPEGVTSANNIYEIANAIPIRVNRTDLNTNEKGWIVIQKAEAVSSSSASRITASKLCVDKTYTWCDERIHIDQNFQYIDAYGNNKGSRFRMYLRGELPNYWWRGNVTAISGDN